MWAHFIILSENFYNYLHYYIFLLALEMLIRVKRGGESLCYFNFNIALLSNCSPNQHPTQCSLPNSKWLTAYFQLNTLKENSFSSFKKSVLHLILEFFLMLLLWAETYPSKSYVEVQCVQWLFTWYHLCSVSFNPSINWVILLLL